MSTEAHQSSAPSPAAGDTYERRDINPRPLIVAVTASVLVIALIFAGMWFLTGMYARRMARESPRANPLAAQFAVKQPPAPRLQTEPIKDLQTLRAKENQALQSYAWIDRAGGSVRIPIDRAIDLTAERGLPARPAETGGAP